MATMKFYNVTAVPTISSAEGTYYVKDANGYVQEYLVTGGLVNYIGGYPMQDRGTDVEKPMSQKAVTDELALKADQTELDKLASNPFYKGVAIPSTNPGTPDGPMFYIASTQGTYANFGGFVLDGGFAVLSNVSGSWTGTKFLKTEMDAKAAHGYASNPKTLKEVDDNLVQLAGDVNLKEVKANKQNSLATDGTGTKFPTVDAVNGNFATQVEAEANTESTKFMSALRVFQSFVKNANSYVFNTLNTTSKTVFGSINELFVNKVDKTTKINNHPLSGDITIIKSDIGVGNIDNTSDINKPVSTPQQAALDLKLDKATVKQIAGTSITDVMSQKAITDILVTKADHGYPSNPKSLKQVEDLKENSANKQNNLTIDGTGTKFPTVDAVNAGLVAKTSVKQTIGTSTTDVMSQKATTDELNTKALKATLIKAGAGLTGGGTLEQDRTLDIVSANDGITVNADNIQLNTQDVLNGTSTTKPLSAKQGAELNNRINMYGTAGGTAQAITLTVSASITLSAGMRFTFKPIANNTATSPTININNLGAKTILRGINASASAALIANDIVQNIDAILEYDGTNFRLLNPQTGGIAQTTGANTDKVMSQKAVTDELVQVRSDLSEVSLLSANIRTYDAGVIPTIENGTDDDYKQAAINLVPDSLHVGGMTVLYSKQGDPTKKSIFLPLSSFSTNISEWENRASLVRQENKSILENAVTIKPNVFNKWGEMLALDITLGFEVSNELNEYMIEFVSGETPTVFSLQGSVKWADGILVPEPNMTYQVSIVNGLAIYAGWSNI